VVITNPNRIYVRQAVREMRRAIAGHTVVAYARNRMGAVRFIEARTADGRTCVVGYAHA